MRTATKRLIVLLCAVTLAATGFNGIITATTSAPAAAVTGSDFRPGKIITDELFYDSAALSAAEVQTFLNGKVASCTSGYTCLKSYRQTSGSRAADAYCKAYTGQTNETSASIIYRVGKACGVSQMVLLVLLQKEQGLVTSTAPTAEKYQKATGYGCPDTAACDSKYYGFFNQVYMAAWKYKVYRANPGNYNYQAGRSNYILYNPDTDCGGSNVYIQNQATAGLYTYTPYQPNQAALNNLNGTGDSCSAYGNRNFWRYYNSWFGSTDAYPVHGAIGTVYRALGGASGVLGVSTSPERCGLKNSGCYQQFKGGSIHWTSKSGAHATRGAIRTEWQALGWENGFLGYPKGDQGCGLKDSGCYQTFEGGGIHYSANTDAHATRGKIRAAWEAQGWENGKLGYPKGDQGCGLKDSGCYQTFQGGSIHYSANTAAQITTGGIRSAWQASGWQDGPMGYPTSNEKCGLRDSGCYQSFQKGKIHWSSASGAHLTKGAIQKAWAGTGWENGRLRYPTTNEVCSSSTKCVQTFQGGTITWTSGKTPVIRYT
ncbi:hypothetical protein LWF01_11320 [Saxibacter everestensis]|uniref:LGFP repeat-containing protein n=1 Tax=Saxibacter everestensis TaxID=2909229 RepID=A0ABY8QP34_9MICO|nr:hypothetical protein LWF01_11320 [Brevibacteriaceae bacterium ZFBP1038]